MISYVFNALLQTGWTANTVENERTMKPAVLFVKSLYLADRLLTGFNNS